MVCNRSVIHSLPLPGASPENKKNIQPSIIMPALCWAQQLTFSCQNSHNKMSIKTIPNLQRANELQVPPYQDIELSVPLNFQSPRVPRGVSLYSRALLIVFLHLEYLITRYMIFLFFINWVIFFKGGIPSIDKGGQIQVHLVEVCIGKPFENMLNHISTPRNLAFKSTPIPCEVSMKRCEYHKFPSIQ